MNSCCGHDNGTPLAMSIPLAEESMGLSAVYTRSPPLDPSTPYLGDQRLSNSLCKMALSMFWGLHVLFSNHWTLTTQVPVDFQPDLWGRVSGQRRAVSGIALAFQGGPTTSVCLSRFEQAAKGPHSVSTKHCPSYFLPFPSFLMAFVLPLRHFGFVGGRKKE